MPEKNSFATVATQIVNYNNNILELLSSLNEISVSNKADIQVQFTDEFDVLRTYNIPSLGYLLSEIQRLNNNINTLYSIDENGALIQQADNKFKKIITVDLNKEPASVESLETVNTFVKSKNWFFDSLLNPMLQIELDLSDKIEDNVRQCLVRRYIVDFAKNEDGTLTNLGLSAQNSFDNNFRNKSGISLDDFTFWIQTTPGVVNPTDPNYDEQMFDLDPNEVLFDGIFSVLSTEEDTLNRKFWYYLDTLDYIITDTNEPQQLTEGDELIINTDLSTTRYKIIEVSTATTNPRVRLERVEGNEPIPVLAGALKIYSPVIYNKTMKVSIGYNERNVLFVKALNYNNNILSKDWGSGIGYWTNDLTLTSEDSDNGKTMDEFYQNNVLDYGQVLQDLVSKNIPSTLAIAPSAPVLNTDNFKVVQINKHLTDTPDTELLAVKYNTQTNLKSEITQLNEAIKDKTKALKLSKFNSVAEKKSFNNELNSLKNKKDSASKLLQTTVGEILNLSSSVVNKKVPSKYRVRGFWEIPSAVIVSGSKPQEVIQFRIQYRYLSKDGRENPITNIKLINTDGTLDKNASFSNWEEFFTDVRVRTKDETTGEWIWQVQDVSDADTPKINQLEIPIQANELVEIRIKSISEAGYPDSPYESDWSEPIQIEFPDSEQSVLGDSEFILKEASQEELRANIESDLNASGLDIHLSEQITIDNVTYTHDDTSILLTGQKDENGNQISLFDYIVKLEERITSLEESINRSKGILTISILRDEQEFPIKNNEEKRFNVECEDYLTTYTDTNVPTGRVYSNDIIVIKDFTLKIENTAQTSPLGILSNRDYYVNSDFFRTDAPQIFWVNDRDELLSNTSTGNTRTQIDNQFLWSSNFISLDQTTVVKVADNIGNDFQTNNNNSLTDILSSTEYNIGYQENTILDFVNNNNSILEIDKWLDTAPSVASNTKLLTSVHPMVQNLTDIQETNSDKIKEIDPGTDNAILIPINIYFKMNSLNPEDGTGNNYEYINLNNSSTTVRHIKKVRFYLENEADNRPTVFTITFNINRNKIGLQKIIPNTKIAKTSNIR